MNLELPRVFMGKYTSGRRETNGSSFQLSITPLSSSLLSLPHQFLFTDSIISLGYMPPAQSSKK